MRNVERTKARLPMVVGRVTIEVLFEWWDIPTGEEFEVTGVYLTDKNGDRLESYNAWDALTKEERDAVMDAVSEAVDRAVEELERAQEVGNELLGNK